MFTYHPKVIEFNHAIKPHLSLHIEKPFWKWSFDEMISYDIPNSIDYVIKATNHTTVGFIGHSQGSMTMFGLLSTRPIYNDIVKPFIALAPVTSVGHVTTPIRHLAKLRTLKWILKAYGLGILRSSRFSKYLSTSILKKPLKSICANLVFMACGYNKAQLNETRLDVYVQRLPAGTSSHNVLHYAQNVRSGKFEAFDHGAKENLLRYGSKVQPEYDLSRITNEDIVLMRADNDLFVRPKDLAKLKSKLQVPLLQDYRVPLKDWNHIDFIWAKEAGKLEFSVYLINLIAIVITSMIRIITILFHCLLAVYCYDPDLGLETPDLIRLRGFICEEHTIKTHDGFLLTAHRIVHPLVKQVGRPVILQHGLLSSSRDFLINSPAGYLDGYIGKNFNLSSNNLGFELANRGHDVWLTNTRGNTYSRAHIKLSPKDKSFWKWSFDEMIAYDLPRSIDYIIKATNHTTVGYIGHSQGSLIMFGLLSTNPIYNDIVKPFIALAPVTSVGHVTTPIRHLAKLRTLKWILKAYGKGMLGTSRFIKFLSTSIIKKPFKSMVANLIFLACGYHKAQLNETRIDVYIQQLPAGTSSYNVLHYAQNVRSGKFETFDYGAKENLVRYGSKVQPEYDLSRITNKDIVLMRADNDWLVHPKDLAKLKSKLQVPLVEDYRVPLKDWNHIDFIWAKEAGKYVNKKIVDILSKYE
ncbi:Gastric triacylglycerol lipase [Halotydeus destructor]|nr:Gastric triacylglycerol lipase [Halotydeus destructor]